MALDASLFNFQNYKAWIKGKWSNPRKRVEAIEKRAFRFPSTTAGQLTSLYFLLLLSFYYFLFAFSLTFPFISEPSQQGAVEYANFISTERVRPLPMSVLDMTLSHLMVRL